MCFLSAQSTVGAISLLSMHTHLFFPRDASDGDLENGMLAPRNTHLCQIK